MKKITSLALAALLLVSALFTLVSCGSAYGAIEGRFKDAGYTVVDLEDTKYAALKAIKVGLEDGGEVSATFHALAKGDIPLVDLHCALIVEFSANADAQAELNKMLEDGSATLKGLLEDAQASDLVNGNCILIPMPAVADLKDGLAEMTTAFKG